jgi:Trk K+ transport system NAD-binding subunit
MKRGESLTVKVKVKNTGDYDADETVLFYIKDRFGSVIRPVKELKAYEKIHLLKGEEKTVEFTITEESNLKNKMIMDANIPEEILIVMIKRGNQVLVPKGSVLIKEGDKLVLSGNNIERLIEETMI